MNDFLGQLSDICVVEKGKKHWLKTWLLKIKWIPQFKGWNAYHNKFTVTLKTFNNRSIHLHLYTDYCSYFFLQSPKLLVNNITIVHYYLT